VKDFTGGGFGFDGGIEFGVVMGKVNYYYKLNRIIRS